ncbi:MAG TPA: diguanylate cyclase [Candidatus Dormibacteraeota bacterium]|nr:diguanylate cyclase [Candidatus Dormibacteraeota bacterium]
MESEDAPALDPITGLSTAEEFHREARAAVESRTEPLTIAVLDIYGLDVGDAALRTLARVLQTQLRQADTAARLEDGNFALLMRQASLPDAGRVLQRVEDALLDAAVDDNIDCVVEFCSGAAQWNSHEDYPEFLARARLWLEAEKRSRKPGPVVALPNTRDRRRPAPGKASAGGLN